MKQKVFIVAGGPSLKGFNFKRLADYDTIVVNKSLFYVPNPDYFITIDHSFLQKVNNGRNKINKSNASKFFVANFGSGLLVEKGGKIKYKKTNKIYDLKEFDVIVKSWCINGLGDNWGDFRSGNCSGYCAFQLAVILGYYEIYLLGVDLQTCQGKTHFHNGYEKGNYVNNKVLDKYYDSFVEGLDVAENMGIDVISCSETSRLNDIIPLIPLTEL